MSQLQPRIQYPLVYQIFPDDPATYYIRAIIRLSNSGQVWRTVDLVNSGGNRYTGQYLTPGDDTNGVPIDITYYVYTDAQHTTLSQQYDTKNVEHLVFTLASPSIGFSGGGSDGLTPKMIAEIVREELKGYKLPKGFGMEDMELGLNKNMSPYFQTFHDSLMGIYDKNDILEGGLHKLTELHGENGKMLSSVKEELSVLFSNVIKQLKEELSGHFELLMEENGNKLGNSIIDSQSRLEKFSGEVGDNFKKVASVLEELTNNTKGIDGKINQYNYRKIQGLKESLTKIFDDTEKDYQNEEDYLKQAKKLLGN